MQRSLAATELRTHLGLENRDQAEDALHVTDAAAPAGLTLDVVSQNLASIGMEVTVARSQATTPEFSFHWAATNPSLSLRPLLQ